MPVGDSYEVLPSLLKDITEEHEGLRFSVKMINQLTDIDNYEADIAIRSCKKPPEQLIGRKVGTVKFVACASAEYVKSTGLTGFPANPEAHRFIVLDDSYSKSPFYRWLDERLTLTTYRTTVNNFLSARAMCCNHLGITVLPDYMLNSQNQLLQLSTDDFISGNDLWILSHPDSRNMERVKLVRRLLHERLATRFGES